MDSDEDKQVHTERYQATEPLKLPSTNNPKGIVEMQIGTDYHSKLISKKSVKRLGEFHQMEQLSMPQS